MAGEIYTDYERRIDAVLAGRLDGILGRVHEDRPTLVHADLCEYDHACSV